MTENGLVRLVEIPYCFREPVILPDDPQLGELKDETLRRLKDSGLYDPNLLYMPVDALRFSEVKKYGADLKSVREKEITAYPENQDEKIRLAGLEFAIYSAFRHRKKIFFAKKILKDGQFIVACYDSGKFNRYRPFPNMHKLKDGFSFREALRFVIVYDRQQ